MAGTVTFDPTQADWVAANRLWLAHSRWRRWFRWVIVAVVALILVDLLLQLAIAPGDVKAAVLDAAVPIVVLIGITLAYWLTPLTIARGVRMQFTQRRTMGERTTVDWNDERLTMANESGSTTLRWPDLYRWMEDETAFAFLLTDRLILMVPNAR